MHVMYEEYLGTYLAQLHCSCVLVIRLSICYRSTVPRSLAFKVYLITYMCLSSTAFTNTITYFVMRLQQEYIFVWTQLLLQIKRKCTIL